MKVLAAGVSLPTSSAREGVHPETARVPYTPRWDLVGTVDQLGETVTDIEVGHTVAAMPIHGCYAQYLCLPRRKVVPVPPGLDAAEAVAVVLNYITAFQMLPSRAREDLRRLDEIAEKRFVTSYGYALIYSGLSENEQGLTWLRKAVEDRSHWLVWIRVDPRFDALRGDHRFQQLVTNVFPGS